SEPVAAVVLAEEGVAEDASGFGGRLPQAGAAALGVRVGPERFEQLVAGGAVGVKREVGDQLTGRRASRRRSAFDLEGPEQTDANRRILLGRLGRQLGAGACRGSRRRAGG